MTDSKTPHKIACNAADELTANADCYSEDAYREYLRTLLSDERTFSDLRLAIAEVHSGNVHEANAIIRETISTLKRIAGVE